VNSIQRAVYLIKGRAIEKGVSGYLAPRFNKRRKKQR